MYRWIVFVHVLSALAFFMAHGASAAMAFLVKKEKNPDRLRAILDLSQAAVPFAYFALMGLVIAGIVAGIMSNWYSMGWIWASIVLLVLLFFGMHGYAAAFYTPLRKALGLAYHDRQGEHPAAPPASNAEIIRLAQRTSPRLFTGVSFAVVGVIVYLMMFKPF